MPLFLGPEPEPELEPDLEWQIPRKKLIWKKKRRMLTENLFPQGVYQIQGVLFQEQDQSQLQCSGQIQAVGQEPEIIKGLESEEEAGEAQKHQRPLRLLKDMQL